MTLSLRGKNVVRLRTSIQCCAEKKDCFANHQPSVAGCGWLQPGRNFLSISAISFAQPCSAVQCSFAVRYNQQQQHAVINAQDRKRVKVANGWMGLAPCPVCVWITPRASHAAQWGFLTPPIQIPTTNLVLQMCLTVKEGGQICDFLL